ncbi:uncharacterized protein LY89DRAFT_783409 [Mollisia scopiformis]|uniref:Uncharacterized protein n=1 Tax=Mollisia scopiformis TaxID=149040 RepID=A0A194X573_MOLSC|nr:uncharacterized protein LY89DRAFT_783409 [Mollisia scopiformis]KUJ15214.1 hypothetical protein LY89DRAFT_783409 [Mollisia scopiformis]
MALADEVFCDMKATVRYCDEPIQKDMIKLDVTGSAKKLPVLRSFYTNKENKAWSYASCHTQLIRLGYRMGFEKSATSYAIRLQCANLLCATVAPAQAGKILGQKGPSVLQKSYASTISGIDVQSLYQKKPMHTSDIAKMTRLKFSNNLRKGAPYRLLRKERLAALQTEEVQDLSRRRERGTVSKQQLDVAKARAKREYIAKLRQDYFERSSNEYAELALDDLGPCRARVVELMYCHCYHMTFGHVLD